MIIHHSFVCTFSPTVTSGPENNPVKGWSQTYSFHPWDMSKNICWEDFVTCMQKLKQFFGQCYGRIFFHVAKLKSLKFWIVFYYSLKFEVPQSIKLSGDSWGICRFTEGQQRCLNLISYAAILATQCARRIWKIYSFLFSLRYQDLGMLRTVA